MYDEGGRVAIPAIEESDIDAFRLADLPFPTMFASRGLTLRGTPFRFVCLNDAAVA
jgi:hypothetical protein